ncbi:MAG: DNRLRE domain-containing protein, partial [Oscillospiraceae bacterium]|nr:DNRLRE domain-containing protein [Oscillospiraceae bacterium]
MKRTLKILAMILTVIMLTQSLPMGAIAVDGISYTIGDMVALDISPGESPAAQITPERAASAGVGELIVNENTGKETTLILGEVEALRKENTKYFRHADGTFTAALYAEPVHYEDANGNWQDIDNTLRAKTVQGETVYEPTASGVNIKIPKKFEGDQELTVSKDGHTVGLRVSADNTDVQLSKPGLVMDVEQLESEKHVADLTASHVNAPASTLPPRSEEIREANAEKTELENLTSAVTYKDIFPGADLEYIVTPGKIKENIVVKEAQDEYIYKFDFTRGGLAAVPQENGSVYLLENAGDAEPLFILQAPFMYDAAAEESTALTMTLSENGTLVLTADAAWINDDARVFPVVIDPTITTYASGFQDAYISNALLSKSTNYNSGTLNYAGKGLLGTRRTYIKFTLPTLPESSVVNQAVFRIAQYSCDYYSDGKYMYLFDLTGKSSWTEGGVTWNSQPVSGDVNGPCNDGTKILDYQPVNPSSNVTYTFNITRAVKNWYETSGTNNGLMLTTSDESANTQACLYSARSVHVPTVQVWYSANIGLEDYWSYETVDFGRSGTAYVNDQNGGLTYVHSDLSMNGNRLPISIAHVNTTNRDNASGTYLSMKLGVGFRLNIMEELILIPGSSGSDSLYDRGYRYTLIDSDGTAHYFKVQANGAITNEYDVTQVLTTSGGLKLTDAQGNKKYFEAPSGLGFYLTKLEDNNGNAQNITWSGNRITQVTDPAGRAASFVYNASNYLTSITDPAGRSTQFTYSGDQLTTITYPDGKTTAFLYNANKISRVTAYDSSYITLSYKTIYSSRYRVDSLYQYDKAGVQADRLQFFYSTSNASGKASGNTVVKNSFGKEKAFLFNAVGHVLNVTNQDEQTQYRVYGASTDNPNEFNKPIANSELQTISNNALKNHGFEQASDWTHWRAGPVGSATYNTTENKLGTRSMLVQSNASCLNGAGQNFIGAAGQTYTVSADTFIPAELQSAKGVWIGINYEISGGSRVDNISEYIRSTRGWERFSHTMTLPQNATGNCRVMLVIEAAEGLVYFDNVQLEKSGGSRYYNLIANSDFSYGTGTNISPWTASGTQSADAVYTVAAEGRNEMRMAGSPAGAKQVSQSVPVNAQAGDVLIIGGKAGAYASGADGDGRLFSIRANIYSDAGGTPVTVDIPFDRSITQEHQIAAKYVVLEAPCHHIVYTFCFNKQIGNVAFAKAFVYVGNYGERNSYDTTGRLTKVVNDDAHKSTEYTYNSSNDIVSVDETLSGTERNVAEIEYDAHHNPIQITNSFGNEVAFEYLNGQVTSQTTTDTATEKSMTESMTYIQGGNYLKTQTDASGGVTTYYYDNNDNPTKGLVMKAKDPNNNETIYTYNANTDELLSTTGKSNASTSVAMNFTTQDYLPKTVVRNGTTYSYDYDNRSRVTSAKIGTQPLVTNSYDTRQRLSQQTFANGAAYQPVYDSRDRTVGERWNGTQIVSYSYNENDRLSQMTDFTGSTPVTYKYDYAFLGRMNKITGSDGTQTLYDYDMSGALVDLTFQKNNEVIHQARYHRNEKGSQEDVILRSLGNTALHFNYDCFDRLTGQSAGPIISSRTYLETGNTTTNRVSEFKNEKHNATLQQYGYTYDANGNITQITEAVADTTATYTYDGLSRLTGETGPAGSYAYNYDAGGNLTSVTQGGTVAHSYTYGNTNWKDQLTAVNGDAITYDAVGNPLTFAGYTFTWQRGRQLAGVSGNGVSISYTYDTAGRRTRQVVNGTTINYLYAGDLLMRRNDGTNILDFAYDANGSTIGFKCNGTPYLYLRNLQGDVVGITDAAGNTVGSYTYDAWGNITAYSGAMAGINPIRYRGYYQDPLTGWYFLNTRYYNPSWRRFLNADALFIAGNDSINGSNMYAYCNGNPVMHIDPSGMGVFRDALVWLGEKIPGLNRLGEAYDNETNKVSKAVSGWVGENVMTPGAEVFMKNIAPGVSTVMDGAYSNPLWHIPWNERRYDAIPVANNFHLRDLPGLSFDMRIFSGAGALALDFHKNNNLFSKNYGNYTTLE